MLPLALQFTTSPKAYLQQFLLANSLYLAIKKKMLFNLKLKIHFEGLEQASIRTRISYGRDVRIIRLGI